MKIIDPGHLYELHCLDAVVTENLRHVKRMGTKYPGNTTAYPGTTTQEVLRVEIDRVKFLQKQEFDMCNDLVLAHLRNAIMWLEIRAATKHKRDPHTFINHPAIELEEYCLQCGHIGCKGACHA